MMTCPRFAAALLLLLLPAMAAADIFAPAGDETQWDKALLVPGFFISSDNENFRSEKFRLGYMPRYEHPDRYAGFSLQTNYYKQDDWSTRGEQIGVVTKAINPRTGLGYNLNLNLSRINGHELLTTESSWGFRINDKTTAEFFVGSEWVETQAALEDGVHYQLIGAAIDYQLTERLSVGAVAGGMFFSDNNDRPFLRLRAVYELLPEHGITLQLRHRQHETRKDSPYYFSPERYEETMLALGMRKRVNGWVLTGLAGLGEQRVDRANGTRTELLEFSATSPIMNKVFFRFRAGYTTSAGLVDDPDYSYSYLNGELIVRF